MLSLKGAAAIHRLAFLRAEAGRGTMGKAIGSPGQAAVVSRWLRPGNEGPGMELIL